MDVWQRRFPDRTTTIYPKTKNKNILKHHHIAFKIFSPLKSLILDHYNNEAKDDPFTISEIKSKIVSSFYTFIQREYFFFSWQLVFTEVHTRRTDPLLCFLHNINSPGHKIDSVYFTPHPKTGVRPTGPCSRRAGPVFFCFGVKETKHIHFALRSARGQNKISFLPQKKRKKNEMAQIQINIIL